MIMEVQMGDVVRMPLRASKESSTLILHTLEDIFGDIPRELRKRI